MRLSILLFVFIPWLGFSQSIIDEGKLQKRAGFFDTYYSIKKDKIYLEVVNLDSSFLYVSSLSQGLGNNDLGLDRGQLGGTRVVHFKKSGNKLLLVQPNLKYRAITANELERRSVEEAFAKSILFGFPIIEKTNKGYLIDMTPFLMEDTHGVINVLKDNKQGIFKIDTSKCAINNDRTKSFPENIEFDIIMTLKGRGQGRELISVAPDADNVTIYQHHSFIKLPDNNYTPRLAHVNGGSYTTDYMNYSSDISENMQVQYIQRHRLEKKNPDAKSSEAVEAIIYYLDNGTPEPVRTALLEGARWWDEAFESIGYENAFQVKILPDTIDPLDVRYNVIQWVHRSTRGWSYGASVADPRTGEIIKGHVSLGSLRVRQDYKIAKALSCNADPAEIEEFALARIRQLSAHEVGHTLGMQHNFAASMNERASVMDYPHPWVSLEDGKIKLNNAYDTGIGEWDKYAIAFAYGDKSHDQRVRDLDAVFKKGYRYVTDEDSRPLGGSNAFGHLWDNGSDPIVELENVLAVRQEAIDNFGWDCVVDGEDATQLEDLFVLLYFYHRYQAEAVLKLIAGREYGYHVKGETEIASDLVSADRQREALASMMKLLDVELLKIPNRIMREFSDRGFILPRDRESFSSLSELSFDPLSAALSNIEFILNGLLHPSRINRLVSQLSYDPAQLSLHELIGHLLDKKRYVSLLNPYEDQLRHSLNYAIVGHMIKLARMEALHPQARAIVNHALHEHKTNVISLERSELHSMELARLIELYFEDPEQIKFAPVSRMPDGSPIGSNFCSH